MLRSPRRAHALFPLAMWFARPAPPPALPGLADTLVWGRQVLGTRMERMQGDTRKRPPNAFFLSSPLRHLPPAHSCCWPPLSQPSRSPSSFHNTTALALLIPLLRLALHTAALDPLARAILRAPPRPRATAAEERRVSKFAEAGWKCGAYALLSLLGFAAARGAAWAPPPLGPPGTTLASARVAMWAGWPGKGRAAAPLPPPLARYWTAQASFYAASLAMLFAWEHRRSDFPVMVAHHLTTVALIGGAAAARLEVPGAAVAALHDPADVFLEFAKLASAAGCPGAATASFLALMLTWGITRLGLLPLVASDAWRAGTVGGIPAAKPLAVLLWALVAMHSYWFALIARIAVGQLVRGGGRVTQDVRESDEVEAGGGGEEKGKGQQR